MNKQSKTKAGKTSRGIEWTDYTWNPVAGCHHRCRWRTKDGNVAICYAELVANRVGRNAYPNGFEHTYWHPQRLIEPQKLKKPARIFVGSMTDIMGNWISHEQILTVLNAISVAKHHQFQILTKNAPRLQKFIFPPNTWVGVSSPPDFMFGNELSQKSKESMLDKSLRILSKISNITWMSIEPLSWDVSPIIEKYPNALDWVVIGAATNGSSTCYQPDPRHIEKLLHILDNFDIPVFFKGNLNWHPWREDFPDEDSDTPDFFITLFEAQEAILKMENGFSNMKKTVKEPFTEPLRKWVENYFKPSKEKNTNEDTNN